MGALYCSFHPYSPPCQRLLHVNICHDNACSVVEGMLLEVAALAIVEEVSACVGNLRMQLSQEFALNYSCLTIRVSLKPLCFPHDHALPFTASIRLYCVLLGVKRRGKRYLALITCFTKRGFMTEPPCLTLYRSLHPPNLVSFCG